MKNKDFWSKVKWISAVATEGAEGIPLFRKKFNLSKKPAKATLYATSLGVYDAYINSQRVGNDEMKPGWTDYDKRVLYYTYDITDLLKEENCILFAVASGWWNGRISYGTYANNDIALAAYIQLEYEDESVERIVTDRTWQSKIGGPVISADIWDGETYNANIDSYSKMSTVEYKGTKWKKPVLFKHFHGIITEHIGPTVKVRPQLCLDPVKSVLYSSINDNGTEHGEIIEDKVVEGKYTGKIKAGTTLVIDLGQNMVGWEKVTIKGKKNTTVTFRFGEMLNDSGAVSRGNDGPKGSIYTANYRTAKATGQYIMKGAKEGETYRPNFTFFGFRYVEITADKDINLIDFKAEFVSSDMTETGFVETSSDDVNKLISNVFWGQRCNYLSVPTDCPQRDERLGWTGDTQIFVGTGAYNADVRGFFHKWMQDVRDSQSEDGRYSDVVPRSRVVGMGNAAWGDAGIVVPYVIYRTYADIDIIKECYASMTKYMNFLIKHTNMNGPAGGYGDWLAYEPTDKQYIGVAYYAYDSTLMSQMASALMEDAQKSGDEALAKKYAKDAAKYSNLFKKVKKAFQARYMPEGELVETSQTAYLLALYFDLLPKAYAKKIRKRLLEKIKENGYKLSTGFVGTGIINKTLSENGATNMGYSLLLQTQNPSWLYSVYQGATTIWERWNSYTLETGFGKVAMHSFNHYAYGSVLEWVYKYVAGIDTDANIAGYKHIVLRPMPDTRKKSELPEGQSKITWVRAKYDSVSGTIESAWSVEDGLFTYEATVPEGTVASVHIPVFDKNAKTIVINGVVHSTEEYEVKELSCVKCYVIDCAPGKYTFEIMM